MASKNPELLALFLAKRGVVGSLIKSESLGVESGGSCRTVTVTGFATEVVGSPREIMYLIGLAAQNKEVTLYSVAVV